MSKKTKRKIHLDSEVWNWWVTSGRYSEATHVSFLSPNREYYKVKVEDVTHIPLSDDNEGMHSIVKPSMVREYIIENLI